MFVHFFFEPDRLWGLDMHFPKLALIVLLAAVFTAGQNAAGIPGYALYKAGNFSAAISALESARKDAVHKSNPQVWNLLGVAYVSAGSAKKALKPLQTAIKLAPDNGTYRGNLAYAYLLDRKIKKAREEAERAIRLDPRAHNAYLVRARASLMEYAPRASGERCGQNDRDLAVLSGRVYSKVADLDGPSKQPRR